MRSRYILGFAAALGFAGTAAAQTSTGRGGYTPAQGTGRVTIPTGQPPRVNYTVPQMPARGTAGVPVPAARAAEQPVVTPPAAQQEPWAAPGAPRPAAATLPPPTVTQVRHQDPTPPATLPTVSPGVTAGPLAGSGVPAFGAPPARSAPTFTPPSAYTPASSATYYPSPAALASQPGPGSCATPACAPTYNPVSCGVPCADPGCPCGPVPCAWVRAEWLFWATSGQNLPPLATTSPAGTARDMAGRLNNPSTTVLYGGNKVNDDFRSGLRVSGGFWLDECGTWGLDGDFFFLGRSRDRFAAGSDANGSPILARPFSNAITGGADAQLVSLPNAELVSLPGILAGTVTAEAKNSLIGGGVNLVHNLCCDPCSRLNLIAGYRYLGLTDEVTITEDLTALSGQTRVPAGSRYQITDRFRTENHFHGGTIGLSGEHRAGFCFISGRASVALGSVRQITEINGSTTITPPGGTPTTYAGGLLAQPSNIGRYETNRFAVLPEVSLRVGAQVTDSCRAYVGYNFLYLSSVARAGDQIDTLVNTNQLPPQTVFGGPSRPTFLDRTTGFWAQGVSVGLQIDF